MGTKPCKRLLIAFSFLLPTPATAYNFLYIHPTTGEPITWEGGTTIEYYLDPGPLGRLTNDQAHTLLKEAMKIWEEASPLAQVPHFEFAGYLPEDVTGENYEDYVSLFQCYTDDLESCSSQAQRDLKTVIVFDENVAILGKELCRITPCSANAGARVFSGSSADPGNIVQGIAVFGPFSPTAFVGIALHELGHLLGLAHLVVNQELLTNNTSGLSLYLIPTMVSGTVGRSQTTLNPDDIAGISVLYPSADMEANTATIKGEILKLDLSPMMHVNVIARNIEDPLCEAYSFLSGRVCPEDLVSFPNDITGGTCYSDGEFIPTGNFALSALPPGSYTLEVEEVANKNLALTLAPGLVDPFIYGDAEFWNGGDQAEEENTLSSVITLSAGEVKDGVDIILNRSEVTEDRIKFISLDNFTEGPNTLCPEEPPVDYEELVGWEEEDEVDETADPASGCALIPR